VTVYAPSSQLEDIEQVETEPIDLSEITETTTLEVALLVPDNATSLSRETIDVTVEVEEETETTLENIDITIDNVTDGLNATFVSPESGQIAVTFSGFPSDLEAMNVDQLDLVVNANNLEEGEYNRPLEYNQLDDINVTLSLENVTIRIN
jgi:YbbR domain-containing protein